jgi:hypothetical protein
MVNPWVNPKKQKTKIIILLLLYKTLIHCRATPHFDQIQSISNPCTCARHSAIADEGTSSWVGVGECSTIAPAGHAGPRFATNLWRFSKQIYSTTVEMAPLDK